MGICYRAYLFDEFNWNYVDFDRTTIVDQVKNIIPHAELEADIRNLMIFYLDKTHPDNLLGKVLCDKIMVSTDHENHMDIKECDGYLTDDDDDDDDDDDEG